MTAPRKRRPVGSQNPRASLPAPLGAYSFFTRSGNHLFLSGIGPRTPGTDAVPGAVRDARGRVISYDVSAQCRSVFRNVEAVLQVAGARKEDLIDVTVFLTNLPRDFALFNKAYGAWMGTLRPSRTTVGVSHLPTPIAVELKCVASVKRR